MASPAQFPRLLFVTGTDTGVGKTLLTAALVDFMRCRGVRAHGMKPFCSGGIRDVRLLEQVMQGELTREQINPFRFSQPLAPLVAAKPEQRRVRLEDVAARIEAAAAACDCLVVEGIGGLMVPLAEDFGVADLIARVARDVVIVARNRLGTINHTLLTIDCLAARMRARAGEDSRSAPRIKVVLMGRKKADASASSNPGALRRLRPWVPILELPFLGARAAGIRAIENNRKKIEKVLAQILRTHIV